MNLVLGIVVATVAISAMIAIRIISSERAMQERLKHTRPDDCDSASCSGGCGTDRQIPFHIRTHP